MRQRPGICPLIRAVLPKERLKSMNIGIGGRIIRHKQLMPTLDCGPPVTQRLFCRLHFRLIFLLNSFSVWIRSG